MKRYFYSLLAKYFGFYVPADAALVEINPRNDLLGEYFPHRVALAVDDGEERLAALAPDYVLLNGTVHYEEDIQALLETLHRALPARSRVLVAYYSGLWRPLVRLASRLGLRAPDAERNWVATEDIVNLSRLAGFEMVSRECRVLLPVRLPWLSGIVNRYLAPLPGFRWACLVNIAVLRPLKPVERPVPPSVSVVVPARNEAGNIAEIAARLPALGPADELIFVEGGSSDDTWNEILAVQARYRGKLDIVAIRQDGKGKGDAVRKGFSVATRDILMILDADLTVPPEELPRFHAALARGQGEFINGSRLVYPMEDGAMRFFNVLGNKFFALAFSFLLGQRFKDTLCGTKAITRENYERLARQRGYFGKLDPFGDFDLIFGAARLGLRIVELPVHYRERRYGETNIRRWHHGTLLLAMTLLAARKIKFL